MSHPLVDRIRATLRNSPPRTVPAWRILRRGWSGELKSQLGSEVVQIALELVDEVPCGRLTAYELITSHPAAVGALTPEAVELLGRGLDDWGSIDAFACYVAGPAWREGRIPTRLIHRWLRSSNRWQRRLAVVCTIALNVRARGGTGDVDRTLAVCQQVVTDREDMVVKGLSWALRSLVEWDRAAVAEFLKEHELSLPGRVKREVMTKIETGRKRRPKPSDAVERPPAKHVAKTVRDSRKVQ